MSKGREIRAYDYVNQPYERVQKALREHADAIFRDATRGARSRAHDIATGLHVNIGGIDVAAEIDLEVTGVDDFDHAPISGRPTGGDAMRLHVEWESARAPRLFPIMRGHLTAYALTATETQLDFRGEYQPPLGPLGRAIDAVAGHRIAEASVHRFVSDVAQYLRDRLGDDG